MAEFTPMKRQYNEIKSNYKDCLLFFRLGDFYEMFDEDAKTASRELDLTLTTRDRNVENPEERTPMCGVPYHSSEAYIARLIAKGYKVAICEQTEDPALAKGIVSRDVIRVITPGTVTESSMLEEGRSNYICAVYLDSGSGSVAFCDISTGEFCVSSFKDDAPSHILNELGCFCPREAVLNPEAADSMWLIEFLGKRLDCIWEQNEERFDLLKGSALLCKQFQAADVADIGLGGQSNCIRAAGGLLSYILETQKNDLGHINTLDVVSDQRYMELDYMTRRNLELTENQRTGEKKGSLLWVLDKTKTPMGSRLLRAWTEKPLRSPVAIKRRLTAVQELFLNHVLRGELMTDLREIGDIQRLVGRAVYGTANGRDLQALGAYCEKLPHIKELISQTSCSILREMAVMDGLGDVRQIIERAICDDPPFSVREGGMIRSGYSEELDRLREIRDNGAMMVAKLEIRERERTGIKKLKIGYNRVFGYYLDVPRSTGDAVPDYFIRKQTLVSNERYFTEELKELENELLTARDRIAEIEYQIFTEIRQRVALQVARIQTAAEAISQLDALCSMAEVAVKNNFVMPELDMTKSINIIEGRHPVVEQTQKDTLFVPNDAFLNDADDRVAIITGPNMAGKSTYMRQTALIVLMAQMGSFVPARSAIIGIVDRVFTRIGASDDLAAGQSTFMVEMTETASILKHATSSSLLILDEIGRGTSTYDGMAIARAVLEHCSDKRRLGAKTMFATHYHELSVLEGQLPGVKNYNITAKKQGGKLIFLRKIVPGAADDSYGIEVAKLAGVPDSIIIKAKEYLRELEEGRASPVAQTNRDEAQISITDVGAHDAFLKLKSLNVDTMTPIEALNHLYELKKKVEA